MRTVHRHRAMNRIRVVHGLLYFGVCCAAIAVSACSSPRIEDVVQGIEQRGHYIEGVPFFKQAEDDCGPTAMASVLGFLGRHTMPEEIRAEIFTPKLRGTLPMDMEQYVRSQGLHAESMKGRLDDIEAAIRKNIPVILLLDMGFGPYRRPHYVVAIGFDRVKRVVLMHDGRTENRVMGYDDLEHAWRRAGYWMLIVKEAGQG